jgi:hypothetical protein
MASAASELAPLHAEWDEVLIARVRGPDAVLRDELALAFHRKWNLVGYSAHATQRPSEDRIEFLALIPQQLWGWLSLPDRVQFADRHFWEKRKGNPGSGKGAGG